MKCFRCKDQERAETSSYCPACIREMYVARKGGVVSSTPVRSTPEENREAMIRDYRSRRPLPADCTRRAPSEHPSVGIAVLYRGMAL